MFQEFVGLYLNLWYI